MVEENREVTPRNNVLESHPHPYLLAAIVGGHLKLKSRDMQAVAGRTRLLTYSRTAYQPALCLCTAAPCKRPTQSGSLPQARRLSATTSTSSSGSSRASRVHRPRKTASASAAAATAGTTMATATQISANKHCGGYNRRYKHSSSTLSCDMTFTVYFPPNADESNPQATKVPIIYYLSGLTCTDENVIQKSGVQRACAEHGIAFIAPDTSPRGLNVEGESESWDFGVGAGFYVNATVDKWKNWCMYDYVTKVNERRRNRVTQTVAMHLVVIGA
eukprot:GHUV01007985.1.p1 GENE.GHUV01007985.1~~GHUV01007985.1.p1  ORF type:complete len:273 (+),score=52.00 GHUV01007985.1:23-841(+)